jgi:hypothetical protein
MEQLTKVRTRALVIGIITGAIVFALAMLLRERKFVNKATGRYSWCGSHYVFVSLTNPPAPYGTFPDTFEICTNDTVTWTPYPGEPITKFVIDFNYDGQHPEKPFRNSSGSGDQGHFEWPKDANGQDHLTTGGANEPCLTGGCTYVFFGSKYFKYQITVTAIDPTTGKPLDHGPFDPGGRIWK